MQSKSRAERVEGAAIVLGLSISGLFKYIAGMKRNHDRRKGNVLLAGSLLLSALGYAPIPVVGGISGTGTILLGKLIDWFWGNPAEGLGTAVKLYVAQWIDWPLSQKGEVSVLGLCDLTKGERDRFVDRRQLIMQSACTPGF
jgi:hypothetical protein